MKVLKINPDRPEKELIELAVGALRNDGIMVYPTDTLYGLGCNALSGKAIKKVYSAKGRDFNKPLSVAFHSLEQAKDYVQFSPIALKLAKKFLPGPLTIILPKKHEFPKELNSGMKNVGIRIPDSKIALEIIKEFGYPITATSANISGENDPVTAGDVAKQIGDKVDLIVDGGKCKLSKPSTIIDVTNKKIKIIREGVINKSMLKIQ